LESLIEPQEKRIKFLQSEAEKIRKEMQAKIDEMMSEAEKLRIEIFDTRKAMRELRMEIDALKRRLSIELDNERKKEEFKSNVLTFSKRIKNYQYMDKILPHQEEGAYILATNERAILGDKRGLGKTLTSLATLDALQVQKALIVVPDDVFKNFSNEIAYWAPHRQVLPVG